MEISSREESSGQTDQYPLLIERMENHSPHEHVINITTNNDALSGSSPDQQRTGVNSVQNETTSSSPRDPSNHSSSSNRLNTRNSSFSSRGDGYGRRQRSPLNSGLWISVELVVTVSQIVASVVVLSLSKNEHPQAPLFEWIVGYASGCVATLPILYWRFCNRNQGTEQDSPRLRQGFSQNNHTETTPYTPISATQALEEESNRSTETAARNNQIAGTLRSARLNGILDHLKMGLDCFFAVWFVVGNVWIFGGHTTADDAPKLYRLCIVFLTFSCIGYAMPFILCATICCCLPCIISVLGIREEFSQTRGATVESINALPTYKFKLKNDESVNDQDQSAGDAGILAAGTAKERVISGEDAVCCICLAKYGDNEELRELPCAHVFHVECVDKWLKINASCPLCKSEVGEISSTSPTARDAN